MHIKYGTHTRRCVRELLDDLLQRRPGSICAKRDFQNIQATFDLGSGSLDSNARVVEYQDWDHTRGFELGLHIAISGIASLGMMAP